MAGSLREAEDLGEQERLVELLREANEQLIASGLRAQEEAERAAQRAAELDAIFAALAEPVVIFDASGLPVKANPAALAAFGPDLVGTRREIVMETRSIRDPDGRPLTIDELPASRALRGETVIGARLTHTEPQGPKRAYVISAAPLQANGNVSGAVALWHDVTERERLQEEIGRERERIASLAAAQARERDLLKAVMENTKAQLAFLDTEFNFVLVNSAYEAGSGHSAAELIGRNHFDIFPSPENQAVFERVRDTGEAVEFRARPFEFEDQRWRGVTYWDWTLSPVQTWDGQVHGLVLSLMDVTKDVQARQRMEALAQEAQRRAAELDAIISSMADGLVIYDPGGEILHMNDAAARILGYGPGDAARPLKERAEGLALESAEGKPFPLEQTPGLRALAGETVCGETVVLRPRTDAEKWVSVSASPIRRPDGTVAASVVTFADITARHQLEVEREDFIHSISHDLRSPLAIIQGQASILQQSLGKTGHRSRSIGYLLAAAHRMNAMIRDLVDSARLDSGQLLLEKQPVDIRGFVSGLLQRYALVVGEKRVKVSMPADLPPVEADVARLERIVLNLVSNALKYAPPETEVVIAAEVRDGQVVTSVADRGPGIATEDLPHIFRRYYRAQGARKAEGLGLGLYITKVLVEAHGGRVWAESEPGQGATLAFTLPLA